MNQSKRKTLQRLAAAMLAGGVVPWASAHRHVVDWLGQLRRNGEVAIRQPVARLQRHFRLGYRNACALAQWLHDAGHWTLGSHCATLGPKEPA